MEQKMKPDLWYAVLIRTRNLIRERNTSVKTQNRKALISEEVRLLRGNGLQSCLDTINEATVLATRSIANDPELNGEKAYIIPCLSESVIHTEPKRIAFRNLAGLTATLYQYAGQPDLQTFISGNCASTLRLLEQKLSFMPISEDMADMNEGLFERMLITIRAVYFCREAKLIAEVAVLSGQHALANLQAFLKSEQFGAWLAKRFPKYPKTWQHQLTGDPEFLGDEYEGFNAPEASYEFHWSWRHTISGDYEKFITSDQPCDVTLIPPHSAPPFTTLESRLITRQTQNGGEPDA